MVKEVTKEEYEEYLDLKILEFQSEKAQKWQHENLDKMKKRRITQAQYDKEIGL